mmetsp:Transcript_25377/g.66251  ORF Transcript_25377/g.66251 Transcript_25377/m.66251 type:complete len:222 (-) Transcript_25377:1201-1866(-)
MCCSWELRMLPYQLRLDSGALSLGPDWDDLHPNDRLCALGIQHSGGARGQSDRLRGLRQQRVLVRRARQGPGGRGRRQVLRLRRRRAAPRPGRGGRGRGPAGGRVLPARRRRGGALALPGRPGRAAPRARRRARRGRGLRRGAGRGCAGAAAGARAGGPVADDTDPAAAEGSYSDACNTDGGCCSQDRERGLHWMASKRGGGQVLQRPAVHKEGHSRALAQ